MLRSLVLMTILAVPGAALPSLAQATGPAGAGEAPAVEGAQAEAPEAESTTGDAAEGLQFLDGTEVDPADFLWTRRLLVVMTDTPADPALEQQLRNIREREDEFVERHVVVIVDSDPAARSIIRQRLRPRGFMLAIIDKDGEVKQRRPSPRTAREIMAVIDRFPSRRQEILDQMPSGRD